MSIPQQRLIGMYLFAAPNDLTEQNLSNLSAENDLSSPDGLYFDPRGVLWIQTDDSAYTKTTNCMLLAALPSHVGDGKIMTTTTGRNTPVGAMATNDTLKDSLWVQKAVRSQASP